MFGGALVLVEQTLRVELTRDPVAQTCANLRLRQLNSRQTLDLKLRLHPDACERVPLMMRAEGVQLLEERTVLDVLARVCHQLGVELPGDVSSVHVRGSCPRWGDVVEEGTTQRAFVTQNASMRRS